ncbi:NAD kinase [Vagococcus coleopterorum]|uniref:NAD kinase n=1 Tax=Vagococcus coleopterorum TaxID=2714946 RepID=A0A6G8AKZ3_9ENTE|nr:NAD kinase [Vagococcus coleopterorum]QIL45728.1 NAD kinase [Vagococcus coleopterorum]
MKIAIVANDSIESQTVKEKFESLIKESALTIDQMHPEVVISIGGDGTFLSAFHQYKDQLDSVCFAGVHTGHLGFYTDWRDYQLEELIEDLQNDDSRAANYPLIEVEVSYSDGKETGKFLGLNECIIKRNDRTLVADVYIKDELFEHFRGDGLSVATPTGSTGYNKSVGGAVIHPRVNVLQMTEIASINNRVFRTLGSPLVIPSDEWITVQVEPADDYFISLDQLNIPQAGLKEIRYRIADERIQFTGSRHTLFWQRVKDAFIEEYKD